ncbi:LytTR family DNA-binding domain-containing protein [Marivivens marinus]|uniref:LytTR family DNA-binding domain-containing protein n=1 Tax=Marivivens marinus TaxID=3110173 RepID=UPI003B84541F
MKILQAIEDSAAIRFRRRYLEAQKASEGGFGVLIDLSFRLSVTVATSRYLIAGALACVVSLLSTSPLGLHGKPFLVGFLYLFSAILVAVVLSWALMIPVYMIRIRRWIGDTTTLGFNIVVVSCAASFGLYYLGPFFDSGLNFRFWELLIRVGPMITLILWLGFYFMRFPIELLLSQRDGKKGILGASGVISDDSLVSMSAQEHYVEVMTNAGPELIRMTLSEALNKIDPKLGVQIHRSHWVALSAIATIESKAKRLILTDGRSLPISPKRLSELELAISQSDDKRANAKLFAGDYAGSVLLQELERRNTTLRKTLDLMMIDIYRGKPPDRRTALKISKLQMQICASEPLYIVLASVATLFPIFLGSYGTFSIPFYQALVFWLVYLVVAAPITQGLNFAVYYIGVRRRMTGLAVSALLFLIEGLASTFLLYGLLDFAFDGQLASLGLVATGVFANCLAIYTYVHFEVAAHRSMTSWQSKLSYPPLVILLPYELRGELVSVSANGRYVEVTTTAGTGSLRMRFGDALKKLGPTKGIQLHRSHWVAADHITSVQRQEGGTVVVTSTNQSLPIASARIAEVEGLLGA